MNLYWKQVLFLALLFWIIEIDAKAEESPPIITITELDKILSIRSDTTYMVHFWATWCVPCVKELPEIEKIARELADKKLKVILISFDFEKSIETKLVPFLQSKNITSQVLVLKQERGYEWLERINSGWSGALPATIIYNSETLQFHEKSFEYSELKELLLNQFLER